MEEIVLKMGRTGKSLIFIYAILIVLFSNCFRKTAYERCVDMLNKNRTKFEKAAIAFSKQDEFSSIVRCSNSEYIVDASRYFIKYQKFDGQNTVNKNQVVLVLEKYSTSGHALSIFSEEFFYWIDFLRRNDLSEIRKDAGGVFIDIEKFFSDSGLLYVLPDQKDDLRCYYPFDPESRWYVKQIDDKWYHYYE